MNNDLNDEIARKITTQCKWCESIVFIYDIIGDKCVHCSSKELVAEQLDNVYSPEASIHCLEMNDTNKKMCLLKYGYYRDPQT